MYISCLAVSQKCNRFLSMRPSSSSEVTASSSKEAPSADSPSASPVSVLGGRADSYGTLHGRLDLNGRPYRPHRLKHAIGFVPQAYILFDELTIWENLELAASLRAPRTESRGARHRRVHGLIC